MQSMLPALDRSAAEDSLVLRMLCISLGVLVAILPLAHVTGLRNVLIEPVAGAALLQFRFGPWRSVSGFLPWIIGFAFAGASIGWSALRYVSFQSFRTDQFYPFVIFLVSFVLMRFSISRRGILGSASGGDEPCRRVLIICRKIKRCTTSAHQELDQRSDRVRERDPVLGAAGDDAGAGPARPRCARRHRAPVAVDSS